MMLVANAVIRISGEPPILLEIKCHTLRMWLSIVGYAWKDGSFELFGVMLALK